MRITSLLSILLVMFTSTALMAATTVISVRGETGTISNGRVIPLRPGMTLAEGSVVVTGVNSEAVIEINGNRLTVRSLSNMRITSVSTSPGASNAQVNLRRGTVTSEVNRIQGVRTNFRVSTPVATSSVRGTVHTVSYGPENGMRVEVYVGDVDVSSSTGRTVAINRLLTFNQATTEREPSALNSEARDSAIAKITDQFATRDEIILDEAFSGDATNVVQTATDIIDTFSTKSGVIVQIIFEQ